MFEDRNNCPVGAQENEAMGIEAEDLFVGLQVRVKANWLRGRVVSGLVARTIHRERYKGENDWMKKHGGLTAETFLFKPDNDGHQRLVNVSDIV